MKDTLESKVRCQCGQVLPDDEISSFLRCSQCGWVFSPNRWTYNETHLRLGYFDLLKAKETMDKYR